MNVSVKKFHVDMVLKNKGIELDIRTPDGKDHRGDMVVNKKGMIWCPGQTNPENGAQKTWEEIINFFNH